MSEERYFLVSELVGPAVKVAARYVLFLPAVIAVVVGAVTYTTAPSVPTDGPPGWLGDVFGTAAQVAAALLIALALEARYAYVTRASAVMTVAYTGIALASACVGISDDLPESAYKWLLAATAGGGSGALLAVVILAGASISRSITAAQAAQLQSIYGPLKEPPAPPTT